MASKSTELKNLSSRDKATRRKAVRWLFENEINDSLPYFIPFLSDEDIWFRERAKSAFTRWCSDVDIELIEQLLSKDLLEHEYFVSTLLFNFSNEGERIIRKLLNSENYLVRCNVRTFQLSKTEKNLKMLSPSKTGATAMFGSSLPGCNRLEKRVTKNAVGFSCSV